MTNKLPICAVIRADSIASEWNGITHLASRVPFVLLYSPRRPFNFSLNARFSINLRGQVILLDALVAMFHVGAFFSDI